jgi:photosystem II stability/assembly factor-like uncharacterized protein
MKNPFRFLALLICSLASANLSISQWVQDYELRPYNVFSLAAGAAGYVVAGTYGGVFISTNSGISWTSSIFDLNEGGNKISALVVSDPYVFAGTEYDGVYRSTDNGAHWTATGLDSLGYGWGSVTSLAVDGVYLFAGTAAGLARSYDNGTTWTKLNNSTNQIDAVGGLTVSDFNLYVGAYAGSGGVLFVSTDDGGTWAGSDTAGLPFWITPSTIVVSGGRIFAGGDGGGGYVFYSTDNGAIWCSSNIEPTMTKKPSAIYALAISGTNVVAATDTGVFLSDYNDPGWTHNPVQQYAIVYPTWSASSLTGTTVVALTIGGANVVYAGTQGGGVFRSTDNGETWTAMNDAPSTVVNALAGQGNLYAATNQGLALYPGISGCTSPPPSAASLTCPWLDIGSFAGTTVNALAFNENSNLLAGTDDGILFLQMVPGVNGLQTFGNAVNVGLAGTVVDAFTSVYSFPAENWNVYAGTWDGFFRSTDSGVTWTAMNNGMASNARVLSLAQMYQYEAYPFFYLFAGTLDNGVYLSTDTGSTWTAAQNYGLTGGAVQALAVIGTTLFAGTSDGAFFSNDYGQNWTPTGNFANISVNALLVVDSTLYAGTSKGVFYTGNKLINWIAANDGLMNTDVHALSSCYNLELIAGTDDWIWRRPLSEMTGIKQPSIEVPTRFSVSQNYPNPFNPTTVINYQLPVNSAVTLKIYDVLGRKVAALVNGRQNAGYYNTTFNGANLPSGVYFYRLEAGTYHDTKKLLLLK